MKPTAGWPTVFLVTGILTGTGIAQEEFTMTTPAGTQHEMILVPAGGFTMRAAIRWHGDGAAEGTPVYPRFRSASVQGEGLLADRAGQLVAEMELDRPLEEGGLYSQPRLDLSPAGIAVELEMASVDGGRYRAEGSVAVARSGIHRLPIRVRDAAGEQYLLGSVELPVWPTADLAMLTDELAPDWTVAERKVEQIELTQTDQVRTGSATCAILTEESFAGWQITSSPRSRSVRSGTRPCAWRSIPGTWRRAIRIVSPYPRCRGPGSICASISIRWDGRDNSGRPLASGIYLYRLRAGQQVQSRKLLLVQ